MMSYSPVNSITNKQRSIVIILHNYRGLLYEQLIEDLSHKLRQSPASLSYIKNTYKDLQKLEELKIIVRDPIKLGRSKDLIYLTEAGYDYANEILGIQPGYFGSGWDGDWGDFPYELQRPPRPSSPVIQHHLMLADVLLQMERIKYKHPKLSLSWRDNRYNSTKFELEGAIHRFKPDGDVMVNKQRIIIEVDRGTEFGDKLREKFQSYKFYLQHLQSIGENLPTAVLFVCDKYTFNGMQRRWSLISNIFWDVMAEWRTRFNLIGVSSTPEIEKVLIRQGEQQQRLNDFFNKTSRYNTERTKLHVIKAGLGVDWDSPVYSLAKLESGHRLYVFERVEQFETIGLARIYEWYNWHIAAKGKYSDMNQVKYFIPVLLRSVQRQGNVRA